MIDDVIVFDNVVHMFNASEQQIVEPLGRLGQDHWLSMINQVRPPGDNNAMAAPPASKHLPGTGLSRRRAEWSSPILTLTSRWHRQ